MGSHPTGTSAPGPAIAHRVGTEGPLLNRPGIRGGSLPWKRGWGERHGAIGRVARELGVGRAAHRRAPRVVRRSGRWSAADPRFPLTCSHLLSADKSVGDRRRCPPKRADQLAVGLTLFSTPHAPRASTSDVAFGTSGSPRFNSSTTTSRRDSELVLGHPIGHLLGRTPVQAPNANAFADRWIRTARGLPRLVADHRSPTPRACPDRVHPPLQPRAAAPGTPAPDACAF